MTRCFQVNLQTGWGGGEAYTVFFTRALVGIGVEPLLFVHPDNRVWAQRLPTQCKLVPVKSTQEIAAHLGAARAWLLFHTPAKAAELAPLRAAGHFLSAIAHMPLYGRDPSTLKDYDLLYAVSAHVRASLIAAGIARVHAQPLWGVADLRGRAGTSDARVIATSPYDWDQRKLRDKVLSWVYPAYAALRPEAHFARAPGIALGLVSRLTPIKQFPLLFHYLAPLIARHPSFHLEIFGAGGYASVRDLRRALAPVKDRVRFWGQQTDVGAVYRKLDYLLTGLPEKEALGLNILEAQACGTPVLAVRAPPFTETVAEEITGLYYDDPRTDAGASFERLLRRLAGARFQIDPAAAAAHLAQFSEEAYAQRVATMVDASSTAMQDSARK